jgi:hypothetical protein
MSKRLQQLRNKLAEIDQSRAEVKARLKDAETKEQQQERKLDARRKIVVGAHALHHMSKNKDSPFTATLWPILDEYVTRPQDRKLLNEYFETVGLKPLPPLPDPAAHPDQNAAGPQAGKSLKQEFGR